MHLSAHPGLHSKFQAAPRYTVRHCLKKLKKEEKKASGLTHSAVRTRRFAAPRVALQTWSFLSRVFGIIIYSLHIYYEFTQEEKQLFLLSFWCCRFGINSYFVKPSKESMHSQSFQPREHSWAMWDGVGNFFCCLKAVHSKGLRRSQLGPQPQMWDGTPGLCRPASEKNQFTLLVYVPCDG